MSERIKRSEIRVRENEERERERERERRERERERERERRGMEVDPEDIARELLDWGGQLARAKRKPGLKRDCPFERSLEAFQQVVEDAHLWVEEQDQGKEQVRTIFKPWSQENAGRRDGLADVFIVLLRGYGDAFSAQDLVQLVQGTIRDAVQLISCALRRVSKQDIGDQEEIDLVYGIIRILLELGSATTLFEDRYSDQPSKALQQGTAPSSGSIFANATNQEEQHREEKCLDRVPISQRTNQYAQHLRSTCNAVYQERLVQNLYSRMQGSMPKITKRQDLMELFNELVTQMLQSCSNFKQADRYCQALAPSMRPIVVLCWQQISQYSAVESKRRRKLLRKKIACTLQIVSTYAYAAQHMIKKDPVTTLDILPIDIVVAIMESESLRVDVLILDALVRLAINLDFYEAAKSRFSFEGRKAGKEQDASNRLLGLFKSVWNKELSWNEQNELARGLQSGYWRMIRPIKTNHEVLNFMFSVPTQPEHKKDDRKETYLGPSTDVDEIVFGE